MKNFQVEVTVKNSTTYAYVSAFSEAEARAIVQTMFGEGARVGYVAHMMPAW